jgi:hypothetical protein
VIERSRLVTARFLRNRSWRNSAASFNARRFCGACPTARRLWGTTSTDGSGHDLESIAICTRCGYRIYARFDAPAPVIDGEALDDTCPGDMPV